VLPKSGPFMPGRLILYCIDESSQLCSLASGLCRDVDTILATLHAYASDDDRDSNFNLYCGAL
jgi:hypothetical protein